MGVQTVSDGSRGFNNGSEIIKENRRRWDASVLLDELEKMREFKLYFINDKRLILPLMECR